MPVVHIGNPDVLKVGQPVLAIGSPFGFDYSATAGIVSAKSRALPNESYVPFIQTDVPLIRVIQVGHYLTPMVK